MCRSVCVVVCVVACIVACIIACIVGNLVYLHIYNLFNKQIIKWHYAYKIKDEITDLITFH